MFREGGELIHGLLERFQIGRRCCDGNNGGISGGCVGGIGVCPAAVLLDRLDALVVVV